MTVREKNEGKKEMKKKKDWRAKEKRREKMDIKVERIKGVKKRSVEGWKKKEYSKLNNE